ncbi:hypothetical protein BGZ63DRAFT_26876 [Mariannaea sp. PMI_226]|nr:hypothetical protein BGZ63DRAFT_26876 [Mariannaea sp. PMI_226]
MAPYVIFHLIHFYFGHYFFNPFTTMLCLYSVFLSALPPSPHNLVQSTHICVYLVCSKHTHDQDTGRSQGGPGFFVDLFFFSYSTATPKPGRL